MLLFLMFLMFSLILISGAVNAYSKISGSFDDIFSSSAAVRYISNKLRSGEGSEIYQDGSAVVIDCGSVLCVIYSGTDGLYEKYISGDEQPDFSGGDIVFSGTKLHIEPEDGLYLITAEAGKDVFSAYCRA